MSKNTFEPPRKPVNAKPLEPMGKRALERAHKVIASLPHAPTGKPLKARPLAVARLTKDEWTIKRRKMSRKGL